MWRTTDGQWIVITEAPKRLLLRDIVHSFAKHVKAISCRMQDYCRSPSFCSAGGLSDKNGTSLSEGEFAE